MPDGLKTEPASLVFRLFSLRFKVKSNLGRIQNLNYSILIIITDFFFINLQVIYLFLKIW